MRGIRFYAEYPEGTSKRQPVLAATNVVALLIPEDGSSEWYSQPNGDGGSMVLGECLSGVYDYPNSPVAGTAVAREYLEKRCKRVSERVARRIHPELFKRLDGQNEELPPCVLAMKCYCAGHARGNPASEPCDTSEVQS